MLIGRMKNLLLVPNDDESPWVCRGEAITPIAYTMVVMREKIMAEQWEGGEREQEERNEGVKGV